MSGCYDYQYSDCGYEYDECRPRHRRHHDRRYESNCWEYDYNSSYCS